MTYYGRKVGQQLHCERPVGSMRSTVGVTR